LHLRRLFRPHAQHWLRDPDLRLHDRRLYAVPAGGHGGGGMERDRAAARDLGRAAARRFSELPCRKLGTAGSRRIDPPQRPPLAPDRMMFDSPRLILDTWRPFDWEPFRPIATDPEVMRYITGGVPWTDEEIQAFVGRQVKLYAERKFCR